jgi:hypothetical protein
MKKVEWQRMKKAQWQRSTPLGPLITHLLIGLVLLFFHLQSFYRINELEITSFPETAKTIKALRTKFSRILIGYFIFVVVFNFLIWKIEDRFKKEKEKILTFLKINPEDSKKQEELTKLQRKRESYTRILEFILMVGVYSIMIIVIFTILNPIYSLVVIKSDLIFTHWH